MRKLVIALSCLICLTAAGRLGVERKLLWLQNLRGGHQNVLDEQHVGEVPSQHKRQKFIMDVLWQVHRPLVNGELIEMGKELIMDKQMYKEPMDENLQEFIRHAYEHLLLGRTHMYSELDEQHVHQLIGLYKFLLLARDWDTFQHNVCFARLHVNPVVFVHALHMAMSDRWDTQELVMPAIHEVLPQLFYNPEVISSVENVNWGQLITKTHTTKPNLIDVLGMRGIGMWTPGHLLHVGKRGWWHPWQEWRMHMIGAKSGVVVGDVVDDVPEDAMLVGEEKKIVVSVEQTHAMLYLMDDPAWNMFWSHVMHERMLQKVTGRRQWLTEHHSTFGDMIENDAVHHGNKREVNVPEHTWWQHGSANSDEQTGWSSWGQSNKKHVKTPWVVGDEDVNTVSGWTHSDSGNGNVEWWEPTWWKSRKSSWNTNPVEIQSDNWQKPSWKQSWNKPRTWWGKSESVNERDWPVEHEHKKSHSWHGEEVVDVDSLPVTHVKSGRLLHVGRRHMQQVVQPQWQDEWQQQQEPGNWQHQGDESWWQNKKVPNKWQDDEDETWQHNEVPSKWQHHGDKTWWQQTQEPSKWQQHGDKVWWQHNEVPDKWQHDEDKGWQHNEVPSKWQHHGDKTWWQQPQELSNWQHHGSKAWWQNKEAPSKWQHHTENSSDKWSESNWQPEELNWFEKLLKKHHVTHNEDNESDEHRNWHSGIRHKRQVETHKHKHVHDHEHEHEHKHEHEHEHDHDPEHKHEHDHEHEHDHTKCGVFEQDHGPDHTHNVAPRRVVRSVIENVNTIEISPTEELMSVRSGEVFMHNLQQMHARIVMEKIALGVGHDHMVNNWMGEVSKNQGVDWETVGKRKVAEVVQHLKHVIDTELARRHVPHHSEHVLQVIGDVLVGHNGQHGNTWEEMLSELNSGVYGDEHSVLSVSTSQWHAPIFHHFVGEVVELIDAYKSSLAPYHVHDVSWDGVQVHDVHVDRLVTHLEQVDADMINIIDQQLLQSRVNNLEHLQRKVVARQHRLNHDPFEISMDMSVAKSQRVVVRTMLLPKVDHNGNTLSEREQRQHFMMLDAFVHTLEPGVNHITRHSHEISWTMRDVSTLSEIYHHVMNGQSMDDLVGCTCHFPHRLLLPHGTVDGLPVQLVVVVTPVGAQDEILQRLVDVDHVCGMGVAGIHLDRLPLGFPMDRHVVNGEHVHMSNVKVHDTLIYHDNNVRISRI